MAVQVLREAGALHLVDMAILSDANSVYIDTVAEVRGLQVSFACRAIPVLYGPPLKAKQQPGDWCMQGCFCTIATNPAGWKDSALRVRSYHAHSCSQCPLNLCKGLVSHTAQPICLAKSDPALMEASSVFAMRLCSWLM